MLQSLISTYTLTIVLQGSWVGVVNAGPCPQRAESRGERVALLGVDDAASSGISIGGFAPAVLL